MVEQGSGGASQRACLHISTTSLKEGGPLATSTFGSRSCSVSLAKIWQVTASLWFALTNLGIEKLEVNLGIHAKYRVDHLPLRP